MRGLLSKMIGMYLLLLTGVQAFAAQVRIPVEDLPRQDVRTSLREAAAVAGVKGPSGLCKAAELPEGTTECRTFELHNPTQKTVRRALFNRSLLDRFVLASSTATVIQAEGGIAAGGDKDTLAAAALFDLPPGTHEFSLFLGNRHLPASQLWELMSESALQSYVRERDVWLTVLWSLAFCLALFCLVFFGSLGFAPFKYYIFGNLGLFSIVIQLIGGLPSFAPVVLGRLVIGLMPLIFALTLTAFWIFLFRIVPTSRQKYPKIYQFAVLQAVLTNLIALATPLVIDDNRLLFAWLIWQLLALCGVILKMYSEMPKPWRVALVAHVGIALPLFCSGLVLLITRLGHLDYFIAIALVALGLYMFVLCAVASFYAKDNAARKGQLAESMALGRSVQDFLLPANGVFADDHVSYLFRYHPYGDEMSGDWLKHWKTSDGASHFLIGDVTGKGPQAALTVAMVMSVISEAILNQEDAGTCMRSINFQLHRMFDGKIVTAAAAASVYADGRVQIYNAASLGWCIWNKGRFSHHLGRASMLGLHRDIQFGHTDLVLENGDYLLSLTDGIVSHPRSLLRLTSRLSAEIKANPDLEILGDLALKHASSQAIADDRALVAIRIGPTALKSGLAS